MARNRSTSVGRNDKKAAVGGNSSSGRGRERDRKRRGDSVSSSSSSGSSSSDSSSSSRSSGSRSSSSSSTSSSSTSSSSSSSGKDRRANNKRSNKSKSRSVSKSPGRKTGAARPVSSDSRHIEPSDRSRRISTDRDRGHDDRAQLTASRKSPQKTKGSDAAASRRPRSRSTSTSRRKRHDRTPSPRPLRIHIGRLTRNVTKDHVHEIFSAYGSIKLVDFQIDRNHPPYGRGFAFVEYTNADDAENAMKHMDGGQIDGQEITAAPVVVHRNQRVVPQHRRASPVRGGGGRNARFNNWSPPRFRRRGPSPMRGGGGRNRSPRRRSRSPVRRRRSNSSDSSR